LMRTAYASGMKVPGRRHAHIIHIPMTILALTVIIKHLSL